MSILFPKKYQDDQIVFRPFDFSRAESGRRYDFPISSYSKLKHDPNSEIWIVFPNPIKSSIDFYKIVLSLLSGPAAIGFSFRTIKKEHRRKWYIAGFLSAIVVVALIYIYYVSPQGADLLVWAAALLPASGYTIVVGIYLIFAQKYQGTIRGQILIGGRPAKYVKVLLEKIDGANKIAVSDVDFLGSSGEYEFDVWLKKAPATYVVKASYFVDDRNKDDKSSGEIVVTPGEPSIVPTLELVAPQFQTPDPSKGLGTPAQNPVPTA